MNEAVKIPRAATFVVALFCFNGLSMTKREIVFMCCRLLAIYLFMSGIPLLGQTLTTLSFFSSISTSTTSGTIQSLSVNFNNRPSTNVELGLFIFFRLLPALLVWVSAVGLWIFAREFSIRLFENVPEEITSGPIFEIGTEVRSVAFACMGLFFLMQDLPNVALWLLSWIWGYVRWTQMGAPFGGSFSYLWIVRIPIGLWLLFGLRGLAGLWRLAQEKGLTPTR